jgi:hypothetical protein
VTVPPARPPRRRRRRRRVPAWLIAAAGLLVAFLVGVALGEALHDNPKPGGAQTIVRTLSPLTLTPSTVTITVRNP